MKMNAEPAIRQDITPNCSIRTAMIRSPELMPPQTMKQPIPIGAWIAPLQRIIAHPERKRLIADFFRDTTSIIHL